MPERQKRNTTHKSHSLIENLTYLKEKQLMMLEKRLGEVIAEAKQAGIGCDELKEMVEVIYDTNY